MMTITEFLLARIAEDEAVARATEGPKWIAGYERDGEPGKWRGIKAWLVCLPTENPPDAIAVGDTLLSGTQPATSHAVRHDPARVLAECEAKRRIVELHKAWPVLVQQPPEFENFSMSDDPNSMTARMSQRVMWLTEQEYRARFTDEPPTAPMIRALAAVYADHPDYNEAWRADA